MSAMTQTETAPTTIGRAAAPSRIRIADAVPFLGLVFVLILFAVLTGGRSVQPSVLQLIALQSTILMIGCVGVTFSMSHGSFDLSLGGIVGMSATLGGLAGAANPWLTLPVALVVGIAAGVAVAAIHVSLKIPLFMVSLAMMFVGRGVTGLITSNIAISSPPALDVLDEPWFYFSVLAIVVVIGFVLFNFTKIGKYNKAIGSNAIAAAMSGIPVNRYKIIALGLSGAALGVAAYLNMIRGGGVAPQTGSGFEIDVLIALVLGGTTIAGGTGVRIRGAIIGALLYAVLDNGLVMVGVEPAMVGAIKGIVFLVAVAIAYERKSAGEIV